MTQELYCRWQNNQCQQVLLEEGKQIDSCSDLNKRVCLNIILSTIQCIWNTEQNLCQEIIINTDQCNYVSNGQNLSQSMCGNYAGKSCARIKNGQKCGELSVLLNSCNEYILNEYACITMITDYCQWKTQGNGGYCDKANLHTTLCNQKNNKNTCQNVQTIGQFCFWNKTENKCENKVISTCESANFLNKQIACISTQQQLCYYNEITNECKQFLYYKLRGCQNNYNKNACLAGTQNYTWDKNTCNQRKSGQCNASQNQYQCVTTLYNCQWIEDQCYDFKILNKTFCKNLPSNLSDYACQNGSFQPCIYDSITKKCYPDQKKLLGNKILVEISKILEYQDDQFTSPLLSGNCDELLNKKDCIKSRKIDQACIWIDQCQKLTDFTEINCQDNLNMYGCLKVIKQNQNCFWQGQCFELDTSLKIISNVNINVCKNFTVNTIYQSYSCVPHNIDEIKCDSLGISKETCLSITRYQCTWDEQKDSCIYFEYKNQIKCSDYFYVSPYLCQMQETDQCIQNQITKNCEIAVQNSLIIGVSIQVCLSNSQQGVHWNGEICQIDPPNLECENQQRVNYLSCASRINQPCIYNSLSQTCNDKFNLESIRCSTLGLNLFGCVQIQIEPCQFINGQCQLFRDYTASCNSVKNVNAKACASILNQQCQYNSIYKFCYQSQIQKDACNIDGINKLKCLSNTLCDWNQDYLNCQCKSKQLIEICQFQNNEECTQNTLCIYENEICQLKQCYHLLQEECQNQLLAGSVCYLNTLNECQPAKQCEDIINPINLCSSIFINSVSCVQNKNSCVSYNNYSIVCPQSDCLNSKCINEYGYCRQRKCFDYEFKDCNKQDGCYLNIQQVCDELQDCLIIDTKAFGLQASTICNEVSVNNIKCNWQQISQFNSIEICTNQYCDFFGSSVTLCHGNELNGVSCVLTKNYQCISCEEIDEECNCNNQINICQFTNSKCQSISCNSFKTSLQCEQAKDRCYWSEIVQDGSCLLICEKIYDYEQCLERGEECHYEPLVGYCKTGKQYKVNLNMKISFQKFQCTYILFISILMILVLQ